MYECYWDVSLVCNKPPWGRRVVEISTKNRTEREKKGTTFSHVFCFFFYPFDIYIYICSSSIWWPWTWPCLWNRLWGLPSSSSSSCFHEPVIMEYLPPLRDDKNCNWIEFNWNELNWTELNWIELNELTELNWIDWTELNWTELNRTELNRTELNWTELNWIELNWTELNWIELNWTELNRTELNCIELNWTEF